MCLSEVAHEVSGNMYKGLQFISSIVTFANSTDSDIQRRKPTFQGIFCPSKLISTWVLYFNLEKCILFSQQV